MARLLLTRLSRRIISARCLIVVEIACYYWSGYEAPEERWVRGRDDGGGPGGRTVRWSNGLAGLGNDNDGETGKRVERARGGWGENRGREERREEGKGRRRGGRSEEKEEEGEKKNGEKEEDTDDEKEEELPRKRS